MSTAEASTSSGSLPKAVDVVVVGAGISGLVAVRNVLRNGKTVLVLEARNRVGGRVLNHKLSNGSIIESGGAFVGPAQDHILGLAKVLKVATFKEYAEGQNVYVSSTLGTLKYTGTVPPDPLILADAAVLQVRIDKMASEVPVGAPWTAKSAAEWDGITLETWLQQNTVVPAVRNLLLSYLEPAFGTDAMGMSLLFFLWYIATAGNETNPGTFERSSGTAGVAQDSRFVGGSGLIPLRMAAALGNRAAGPRPRHRLVSAVAAQTPSVSAAFADGHADEMRRGLHDAVLTGQGALRFRCARQRRRARLLRPSPARQPPTARRFANLMDARIGPAPKRRPIGRVTWTVLFVPASALPPKS